LAKNLTSSAIYGMLYSKNNYKRINIFVPNGSLTNESFAQNSVVGAAITWTTNANCRYNTTRNIYIYWNKF
jgi:hypothetical protein